MNAIDKVVGFLNPQAGVKRVQARAIMKSMERKYEGAADGRRHSNWMQKANPSVNQLINKDLKKLVARSRELTINNPYARKAPYSITNSVIGTGIIATPFIADTIKDGKIIESKNKEKLQKVIAAAWKEWAESLECDYNGDFNFYGLQYLAMRTVVVSGEVLAIRKKVNTDVNKYGFQILLLEGDYIDTLKDSDKDKDGGYTIKGIKYNSKNKRTGYYIYDRHPSEGNAISKLIPIDDIIHVYDVERTGQNRGVPASSSTLLKQRDLDDYEDAELLGKKAAACMPIFVTNTDPEAQSNTEDKVEAIEPGAINYLQPGETVSFATPPANNGFAEFTKTQHRAIAAGYLMTYEQLTGDLSNVNFSSGRMGWLEFQRQVDYWQYQMFIPRFCEKAFAWFVEGLRIKHGIKEEVKASWTAPRREMIDPVKETNAIRSQMRSGLASWSEMVRQLGFNPEDVFNEMLADQKRFIDAGLMPDSNPYFELKAKLDLVNEAKQDNNTPTDTK